MTSEDMIVLQSSIKTLIDTYDDLEPLLYTDIPTALKITDKSSKVNTNLKELLRSGRLGAYSIRTWMMWYRMPAGIPLLNFCQLIVMSFITQKSFIALK